MLNTLWQTTVEMYMPWLQTLATNDSQSYPWVQADAVVAKDMVNSFCQVVIAMNDLFKGNVITQLHDLLKKNF